MNRLSERLIERTEVKKIMPKFILATLMMFAAFAAAVSASPAGAARQVESGMLHTSDNVAIAYEHYRKGTDSVVIVCPGFYNSKKNRWMRKTVDLILPQYDVIIFDMRGHGQSGGKFTWSAREHMDVDAAVDYARAQGYRQIGIVAFSLGAAAAVNAASRRDDIDSMILISCPSSFRMINYHFWESGMFSDLKDNIECKWEGKGARVANIFIPKEKPINTISRIKQAAILFIHGDTDWVVKELHSKKLYDVTRVHKKLEIIKGGLHAERLIQLQAERMKKLILNWFSKTLK